MTIPTSDPGDTDRHPIQREHRWLVIAFDGRHVTLGRATDPSPEELEHIAGSLREQGMAAWLVVSQGRYHGPGPLELMMVRPLVEVGSATWQEAEAAFMLAHEGVATPG